MRRGQRSRQISRGARARPLGPRLSLPLALPLALMAVLVATPARIAHAQATETTPASAAPVAPAAPAAPSAPAAPAAPPEPAPEPAAAPEPAPDAAELAAPSAEATSDAPAAGTAAAAGASRETLLQAAVDKAAREQPRVVLPWIAAGVGVTTLLVGTAIGVITVTTCDGSCSTGAAWPWVVIAGCTLTSAGSAWLILALNDQAEARHRLERARQELERDRIDREPRATRGPSLSLRASF